MPISHPVPTSSTIKYLYAHAYRCAFDGCTRPLYTVDAQTGHRTLASRVSHICARSEGGPRWNPLQTPEENRSEANLVLMCTEHAARIDDPAVDSVYSREKLLQMKRAQVAEFDQLKQNWILTDNMARTVLDESYLSCGINFEQNSVFHLGGQGGLAPGAGGGGGGAIGKNARAGEGGDGGSLKIDETKYSLPVSGLPTDDWSSFEWDPDPSEAAPPGSGGGGGGAIGENAIGGDGGNGGHRVVGLYDIEAMRRDGFSGKIEIVIGKGGEGARSTLPNQLPKAGEDTVLRFLKEDGSVLKEVRAEGGLAATPSLASYPDGWNELDREQIRKTRFRVTSLMMASTAEVHTNNLYIFRGDWLYYDVPHIPCDVIFNVVFSCRFDNLISELPTIVFLSLFDPTGRETSRAPIVIGPSQAIHGMANCAIALGTTLDLAGKWEVRAWSSSRILAFLEIIVREHSSL